MKVIHLYTVTNIFFYLRENINRRYKSYTKTNSYPCLAISGINKVLLYILFIMFNAYSVFFSYIIYINRNHINNDIISTCWSKRNICCWYWNPVVQSYHKGHVIVANDFKARTKNLPNFNDDNLLTDKLPSYCIAGQPLLIIRHSFLQHSNFFGRNTRVS